MDQTFTAYDELIALIRMATSLSEEQKETYISSLEKGEMTPELQQELADLCETEAKLLDEEIAQREEDLTYVQGVLAEEEKKNEDAKIALVEEHNQALQETEDAYVQDCNRTESELATTIETAARAGEAGEAEEIRKKLKESESQET